MNDLLVLTAVDQNSLANFYNMHDTQSYKGEETTVILAPMYGGIWTLCISITGNNDNSDNIFTIFNYNITYGII